MNEPKDLIKEVTDRMSRKRDEANELTAQLSRQLSFEAEYGVEPHMVKGVVLVPHDRNRGGALQYHSRLAMKDGSERFVEVNFFEYLHGPDWKRIVKARRLARSDRGSQED